VKLEIVLVVCELDSLSRFLSISVLHTQKFSFVRFDILVYFDFDLLTSSLVDKRILQFPES